MGGDEWTTTTLGACASWSSGGTPSKGNPAYWGRDIPWVTAKDMKSFRLSDTEDHLSGLGAAKGLRLAPAGSTLVLVRGMTLHNDVPICFAERDMAFNQDIKALTPDPRVIEPRYLSYWLLANKADILGLVDAASHGTGRLQTDALKLLPMRLPPIEEQRRVARILGALDDKIELNRHMTRSLNRAVSLLFESWVIQTGPRRKITKAVRLEDVADVNSLTARPADLPDVVDYVEISDVACGDVLKTTRYCRGEEPSRARRRLRHGDTVLSTVRPERAAYFLSLSPSTQLIASTGFAVVSPTQVPWSLLHAALTRPEVFEHLGRVADGGAYPAVRPDVVASIRLRIPSDPPVVERFHNLAAPLYERAGLNRLESKTLGTLRDGLLHKLLSAPPASRRVPH